MLEEQDQQARWQQAYGPHRRNSRPYDQGLESPAPPGQGAPGGKDTMTEIQESLTKAAEGKLHRSHRPFSGGVIVTLIHSREEDNRRPLYQSQG